jgi:hypothetical protein
MTTAKPALAEKDKTATNAERRPTAFEIKILDVYRPPICHDPVVVKRFFAPAPRKVLVPVQG